MIGAFEYRPRAKSSTSTTTDETTIDATAAREVPRLHSKPSTMGTNSAPVRKS